MRNLKKALSLALALVMLLGMMVVGAGAAPKFEDVDNGADNQEAIEVMAAINIIKGDEGSKDFRPNDTLTRAEAAVIISKVLLTPKIVDKIAKDNANVTTKFVDVAAYDGGWAAPYVEACVASQVIKGDDDTHFGPEREVSGAEFAAMLLRVLDPEMEDQFKNWPFDWQRTALQIGLDANDADVFAEKLTRAQAAQMAFNAINVGETVTETDTRYVVESTSTAYDVPSSTFAAVAADDDNWTAQSAKGKILFSEAKDTKNGEYYDSFDKAKENGSKVVLAYKYAAQNSTADDKVVKTADYGVHFTVTPMTMTVSVVKDSIGEKSFGLSSATVGADAYGNPTKVWSVGNTPIVSLPNGAVYSTTEGLTSGQLYTALSLREDVAANKVTRIVDGKTGSGVAIESGSTTSIAGKGAEVNVYKAGDKYTITVKNTYVGQIYTWTKAETNPDGQIISGKEEKVTLAAKGANPGLGGAVVNSFKTTAFSAEDKGETYVLYTIKWNTTGINKEKYTINTIEAVETVELTPSRLDTVSNVSSFVADGATYYYSAQSNDPIASNKVATSVAVIFDNYGYVIYNTNPAGNDQYAVLDDYAFSGSGWVSAGQTCSVRLRLSDNTLVERTLYKINGNDPVQEGTAGLGQHQIVAGDVKKIYKWTEDTNGVTLTTPVNSSSGSNIAKNVPGLTGATANDKTVFLIGNTTAKTVARYEGIANVPSVNGSYTVVTDNNGIAVLVYMNDGSLASGVSSRDLTYILNNGIAYTEILAGETTPTTYWVVPAVVNGNVTTVKVNSDTISGLKQGVTMNDHDIITSTVAADALVAGTGMISGMNDSIAPANGIVTLAGTAYSYNAETKVFVNGTNKIDEYTVAELNATAENGKAYEFVGYVQDYVLTYLFVTKTAGEVHSSVASTATVTATATKPVVVNGNVAGTINAAADSTVIINGNVVGTINATAGSTVTIKGDVTGNITAEVGSTVIIDGDQKTPITIKPVTGNTMTQAEVRAVIKNGLWVPAARVTTPDPSHFDLANDMYTINYTVTEATKNQKVRLAFFDASNNVVYWEEKVPSSVGTWMYFMPLKYIGTGYPGTEACGAGSWSGTYIWNDNAAANSATATALFTQGQTYTCKIIDWSEKTDGTGEVLFSYSFTYTPYTPAP